MRKADFVARARGKEKCEDPQQRVLSRNWGTGGDGGRGSKRASSSLSLSLSLSLLYGLMNERREGEEPAVDSLGDETDAEMDDCGCDCDDDGGGGKGER